MTTDELIRTFEQKLKKYSNIVQNNTKELQNLLIDYNNNNTIMCVENNQTVKLDEASIEQMKNIVNKIKIDYNSRVQEQQQSKYRDNQTKLNKYGPGNEYGK